MTFGKRLTRQLKKYLGISDWSSYDDLKKNAGSEEASALLERLPDFLGKIEASYAQDDERVQRAERSLEISSREALSANKRLEKSNMSLTSLLDNLSSGYLVFDTEGTCGEIVSQGAKDILRIDPRGKSIWEVLKVEPEKLESFKDWYGYLVDETLTFEDLASLGEATYVDEDTQKRIEISYKAMRGSAGRVKGVIMVLDDITAEYESHRRAERLKDYSEMVVKYVRDRGSFLNTLAQVRDCSEFFRNWSPGPDCDIFSLLRKMHTLKAATAAMSLSGLSVRIHELESELGALVRLAEAQDGIEIVHDVGAKLMDSFDEFRKTELDFISEEDLLKGETLEVPIRSLVDVVRDLQNDDVDDVIVERYVDTVLRVPFVQLLKPMESNVQSRAMMQEKEVEFSISGPSDLLIIEGPYGELANELGNLINNCVDHGIELPKERRLLGKPSEGRIAIEFSQQETQICVRIVDDGHGIDTEKISAKLESIGRDTSQMSEAELVEAIFMDGVTSRSEANQFAGRGLGMSSLKSLIESLGGTIQVRSEKGKGAEFEILLPILGIESLAA